MRGRMRTVGISIGSKKIAVAEVSINITGLVEVKHLGVNYISDEAIYKGGISDSNAVLQSLREVLTMSNIRNVKQLSMSIEDDPTETRLMTMPSLSKNEILQSLMSEVEDYAILADSEPALDFQIINRINEGGTERMQILFVVAPDDTINSYSSLANSASLKLTAIETIPLSVLRTYNNIIQPESQPDRHVMLVVIEDNHGMLFVLHNKTVRFVHDIEIGSIELKNDQNVDELESEIKQSLSYLESIVPKEGPVDEIVLFADNLEDTDIYENLGNRLDLPVNKPQLPTEMLERFADKIEGNILTVCAVIGSALYKASGKEELTINLIPGKKEAQGSNSRAKVMVMSAILIFVISAFIVASFTLKSATKSVEKDLVALQQQSILEVPDQVELKAIEDSIIQLKARTEVTDVAMNSIKWANCARLLEEVRLLVPSSIWLTRLTWNEDKSATINGYGLSYDTVFRFRRELIGSPYFDPVKLIYIRSSDVSGQTVGQFEIQCGVKREIMGGGKKNVGSS